MALTDAGWRRELIRRRSPGQLSYHGRVDEFLLRLLEICRKGGAPVDMLAELAGEGSATVC